VNEIYHPARLVTLLSGHLWATMLYRHGGSRLVWLPSQYITKHQQAQLMTSSSAINQFYSSSISSIITTSRTPHFLHSHTTSSAIRLQQRAMPRDWARFRRELALPNSAYEQAGEFLVMLLPLHWAEGKPGGGHPKEYEFCSNILISALFNLFRRGTYVDTKRRCVWAVNVDPVSRRVVRKAVMMNSC
jgi:hypothetical protein